jgi:NMD protein affecting ribosome stability and mRNA decay
MISRIDALDRMNTCDARLLRRKLDDVERAIINAADEKYEGVDFDINAKSPVREQVIQELRKAGYSVIERNKHTLTIVWTDL